MYYVDVLPFSKEKGHPYKYDEAGVLLSKIPYTQEYHHHVTAIASYAIANDSQSSDVGIKWLVNNMDDDGAYRHNFTFPFYYNFPKNWIGGLAQGLAISALVNADEVDAAEKAFLALHKHCRYRDKNNNIWIEEYPLDEPAHILNGFVYSLFGVFDLFITTKNKKARKLWEDGLKTLVKNIDRYDMDGWSKYDLAEEMPAQPFYHNVHVKQMAALFSITEDATFFDYEQRWKNRKYTASLKHLCVQNAFDKYGIKGAFARNKERKRWLKSK